MLNVKSKAYSLVIEANAKVNDDEFKVITRPDLEDWLNLNHSTVNFYAFILHKETECHHWHLIVCLDNPRNAKTIMMDLARHFCCVETAISIEPIRDIASCCRYLTHDGFDGKVEYPLEDVITSDHDRFISMTRGIMLETLSVDSLRELCGQCSSLTGIYSVVGLQYAMRYRAVIKDIFIEMKGGYVKEDSK